MWLKAYNKAKLSRDLNQLEFQAVFLSWVEDPDCKIAATITSADTVKRTGINRDVGWSRVEYEGQTLYCITRYLKEAK